MSACIFISGDDDYLVSKKGAEAFAEATAESEDEFAQEIVDGLSQNAADVESCIQQTIQAVQTLSLFGGKKTVWLKNVNFLNDSRTGKATSTKEQVAQLMEAIEPLSDDAACLIITAYPIDRRKKEYKWFQKHTAFHDLKGQAQDIAAILRAECENYNVSIDNSAIEALSAKVGSHTRLMIEEIKKMATYLGDGGKIMESHISELVPHFGEGDFFEVTEAFFSLDLKWTLDALNRHFFVHKEARPLISSLQNRNRLLIQLRSLMDSGSIQIGPRGISKPSFEAAAQQFSAAYDDANAKSSFNVFSQNLWYLGNKVGPTANSVSLKTLIEFQKAFLNSFEQLLRRSNEHHAIMNELAVTCLGTHSS